VYLNYGDDRLRVAIKNDLVAPRNDDAPARGVGILGMNERASALGGTLEVRPSDVNFTVTAELPYRPDA